MVLLVLFPLLQSAAWCSRGLFSGAPSSDAVSVTVSVTIINQLYSPEQKTPHNKHTTTVFN